jgi:hypothetical protein
MKQMGERKTEGHENENWKYAATTHAKCEL